MKKQTISSAIDRRASFFSYFFNKGLGSVGEYKSMTTMIFEKEDPQPDRTVQYIDRTVHHESTIQVDKHVMQDNSTTVIQNSQKSSAEHRHEHLFSDNTSSSVFTHVVQDNRQYVYETQQHTVVHQPKDHLNTTVINRSQYFNKPSATTMKLETYVSLPSHTNIQLTPLSEQVHFEMKQEKETQIVLPQEQSMLTPVIIKALEEKILTHVDEKIKVHTEVQNTRSDTIRQEERIVIRREEKKMADKIYILVKKRWDKELNRKGYLYA